MYHNILFSFSWVYDIIVECAVYYNSKFLFCIFLYLTCICIAVLNWYFSFVIPKWLLWFFRSYFQAWSVPKALDSVGKFDKPTLSSKSVMKLKYYCIPDRPLQKFTQYIIVFWCFTHFSTFFSKPFCIYLIGSILLTVGIFF